MVIVVIVGMLVLIHVLSSMQRPVKRRLNLGIGGALYRAYDNGLNCLTMP